MPLSYCFNHYYVVYDAVWNKAVWWLMVHVNVRSVFFFLGKIAIGGIDNTGVKSYALHAANSSKSSEPHDSLIIFGNNFGYNLGISTQKPEKYPFSDPCIESLAWLRNSKRGPKPSEHISWKTLCQGQTKPNKGGLETGFNWGRGRETKNLTANLLVWERETEGQGWDQGKESAREKTREKGTVEEAAKDSRSREFGKQFLQQQGSDHLVGAIWQGWHPIFIYPWANGPPVALRRGRLLVTDVFTFKGTVVDLWLTRDYESLCFLTSIYLYIIFLLQRQRFERGVGINNSTHFWSSFRKVRSKGF